VLCVVSWWNAYAHGLCYAMRRGRAASTARAVMSVWSSGMILPLGGRGPEFKSRYGPLFYTLLQGFLPPSHYVPYSPFFIFGHLSTGGGCCFPHFDNQLVKVSLSTSAQSKHPPQNSFHVAANVEHISQPVQSGTRYHLESVLQ
jgi:hypothetical protein